MPWVNITLKGIKNEHTGSDPGTALEIRGSIYVVLMARNSQGQLFEKSFVTLWNERNPRDISETTLLPLDEKAQFNVSTSQGEFLRFAHYLVEDDDFTLDDSMISEEDFIVTPQDQGTTKFIMKINDEGDSIIEVIYDIYVYPPMLARPRPYGARPQPATH
ncbi:MAG: hypothetical protein AB6733_00945 [Clostridiaceae bacterium]